MEVIVLEVDIDNRRISLGHGLTELDLGITVSALCYRN